MRALLLSLIALLCGCAPCPGGTSPGPLKTCVCDQGCSDDAQCPGNVCVRAANQACGQCGPFASGCCTSDEECATDVPGGVCVTPPDGGCGACASDVGVVSGQVTYAGASTTPFLNGFVVVVTQPDGGARDGLRIPASGPWSAALTPGVLDITVDAPPGFSTDCDLTPVTSVGSCFSPDGGPPSTARISLSAGADVSGIDFVLVDQ